MVDARSARRSSNTQHKNQRNRNGGPKGIRTRVSDRLVVARGRALATQRHLTSVVIARAEAKTTGAAREAEASLDRPLPPSQAHRSATRQAWLSVSYRGNVDRKWIAAAKNLFVLAR